MKKLLKLMMLIFLMTVYTAFAQTTQTFNSTGTFTVPAGVTSVNVQVWGGGGAGGGNTTTNDGAGGGGGGAYSATNGITVTPGATLTVTVGAAGTGGTGDGGNGGDSWFINNTTILAKGGTGGDAPVSGAGGVAGTGGAAGSGIGTTKFSGGNGGTGRDNSSGQGGPGGSSAGTGANGTSGAAVWSTTTAGAAPTGGGKGGDGGGSGSSGSDATAPGGGGGGAGDKVISNRSGGDGAAGRIIITWTCPTYSLTSVTSATVCIGGTATVTLNGNAANLPVGTYTVTYNQSAPNSATGVTKTMTVTTAGTGSFTTNALAGSGNTTITITNLSSGATGGTCSNTISSGNTVVVAVNALATADAGTNVTTCSNAGAVNITAGSSAANNSGVQWTSSGTGTWTNNNSLTLAEYTPSGADITAGSVTLTLTAIGNSPCGNATDTKTLTINPAPAVTPATICQGGSASLTASASCPNGTGTATGTNTSTFTLTNTSPLYNITLPVSGVPAGATITDVNVSVTIAHNYQSDVVLALVTPGGGTTVSLTGASGAGNSNNLGNTTGTITETSTGAVVTYTFDQAASTQAWGSNNPATAGSFRPASGGGSMNTFNGLTTINGNWTLTADDDANNDNGLITAVSVTIQYTYPGVISWYTVPTGGNVVETGSPFNPVGDAEVIAEGGIYANLVNSNTPGTYTFYAACSSTSTCREAVTFVIDQAATVNAGADVALCNPTTYTLSGSFGGSATSAMWTTSGDGSFDDAGSMGAIYTFGTNDLLGGTVALTLTTNDPAGVCGAVSDNMNIAVRTAVAANPVSASGPSSVCPPATNQTLTVTPVANADSYSWVLAPTTNGVTFNGATNGSSVNVDYGTTSNSSYSIRVYAVNACGTSTGYVSVFTRRAVGAPQYPSGATVACANDVKTYTIPPVTGAETYTWSGPAGSLIDGNPTPYTAAGLTTVNVTFPAGFTSGQVGVAANVACFTSVTKNINVSVATVTTGAITGSTYTVCPGSSYTYSVVPVANAVSYNWVLPNHVTGSSSSNSINVTIQPGFSSAVIKVSAVSVCGVASAQQQKGIATGVAARPASVTGPTNGMCGQTVVNTCPSQAGVTYNWTVPGSATINSGQGSNAVSVTYGTFTTGTVCVTATNACGTSPSRCITVSGAPATPAAITAIPGSWCANTAGVEFDANVSNITGAYTLSWMYPGANICTYVLGGGNSSSLILDWISGNGNVIVTASNACGNGSRIFNAGNSCREDVSESMDAVSTLSVSPNPAHNIININFTSAQSGLAAVAVTDLSGRTVVNTVADVQTGNNTARLNVSHLAKGIYMVMVKHNGEVKQSRIVIE